MFFTLNQVSTLSSPNFEQVLSKYSNLTQTINEEFDRIKELHGRAAQQFFEASSASLLDSLSLRDPQDFFMQGSNQIQLVYAQTNQYLQAISHISQDAQGKIFQLIGDFSPIHVDTVTQYVPAAPSPTMSVTEVSVNSIETKSATKPSIKQNKPVKEKIEVIEVIDVKSVEVMPKPKASSKLAATPKLVATPKLATEKEPKAFFPSAPKKSALAATKTKAVVNSRTKKPTALN